MLRLRSGWHHRLLCNWKEQRRCTRGIPNIGRKKATQKTQQAQNLGSLPSPTTCEVYGDLHPQDRGVYEDASTLDSDA